MHLHEQITEAIIGAFYDVYNELGYGFLESVYERVADDRFGRSWFEGLAAVTYFCSVQ
jgi:hypothetical protein